MESEVSVGDTAALNPAGTFRYGNRAALFPLMVEKVMVGITFVPKTNGASWRGNRALFLPRFGE